MRVALVCPYSLSRPGGVQSQVVGLAGAFRRAGDDVLVVAPFDGEPGAALDGLDAIPGGPPGPGKAIAFVAAGRSLRVPVNGSQAPVALDPRGSRRALRALRAWRPDVVHVHEPFVPMIGPTALFAGVAPVIATFHRSGSGAAYRSMRPLARLALARVDDAVAVSAAARTTLIEVAGAVASRCELVPNGVDLDRFAHAMSWPTERPAVAFLGRHEVRKGLGVLLEAFSVLDRDVALWVIGTGPESGELRSRFGADARIEWCGALADGEVARRLAGAELYVAPSLGGESFGVVLLEAMAAGTAVVASDIEGYRLAAGDAAELVPAGDAPALTAALDALLGDDRRRDALVVAGRARAEELSIDRIAASYRERYARLVDASAPRRRAARARRRNGSTRTS